MFWLPMAFLSALFAGITAILAKCGIRSTDSDVATALRTGVVLMFSWLMVLAAGSAGTLSSLTVLSLVFLVLSGLSTGASWLCYFKALSLGDVNKVAAVDKSSTALTILLAMVFLGERSHPALRLLGTALLAIGVVLMVERRPGHRRWILFAAASALFAALTSILAKIGITGVESNLATAIRTGVVLVMAWAIVLGRGKLPLVKRVPRRELGFILLSGLSTGASWLCYYYAIQNGAVSVVVSVDKLSLVVTVLFSRLVLKERLEKASLVGLALMVLGTLVITFCG